MYSQSISDLEKKKEEKYKEIDYINKLLQTNEKKKKNSLNNLVLIKNKIELRSELISQTEKQIELLDINIYSKTKDVSKLDSTLKEMKKEYARTIYSFYKINKAHGDDNHMFYRLGSLG